MPTNLLDAVSVPTSTPVAPHANGSAQGEAGGARQTVDAFVPGAATGPAEEHRNGSGSAPARDAEAPPFDLDALARDAVAVLFTAAAPVAPAELARVLAISADALVAVVGRLRARPPLGLQVQDAGDAISLVTDPRATPALERFLGAPPPVRLSRAALETLAIIAYRQPATRADVEAVRGVNSDSAVATLLARGLVAEVGRRDTVGRPALLGTTPDFLHYLGLSSLADLLPLRELPAPGVGI